MLFSAICNLIVLGAVHPTSAGEIRASAAQQACPAGDVKHPRPVTDPASAIRSTRLGRFVAPYGVEATFGVRIPAMACCEGHVAPAQAFCDALLARDSVVLWIASRGFGGKTSLLALLAAANAILFETDVTILGGSGQQSARVVERLHQLWAAGHMPREWLASAPGLTKTTFAWGNTIQALTASQTAVRGAHPTRLLLDEIDEMELPILEAAQGQPMDRDGVQAQTVLMPCAPLTSSPPRWRPAISPRPSRTRSSSAAVTPWESVSRVPSATPRTAGSPRSPRTSTSRMA